MLSVHFYIYLITCHLVTVKYQCGVLFAVTVIQVVKWHRQDRSESEPVGKCTYKMLDLKKVNLI